MERQSARRPLPVDWGVAASAIQLDRGRHVAWKDKMHRNSPTWTGCEIVGSPSAQIFSSGPSPNEEVRTSSARHPHRIYPVPTYPRCHDQQGAIDDVRTPLILRTVSADTSPSEVTATFKGYEPDQAYNVSVSIPKRRR